MATEFVGIGLVNLFHPEQVGADKTAQAWLGVRQIARQLVQHAIALFGGGNFVADALTNLPIRLNERGIDCLQRSLLDGSNELRNVGKAHIGAWAWAWA